MVVEAEVDGVEARFGAGSVVDITPWSVQHGSLACTAKWVSIFKHERLSVCVGVLPLSLVSTDS